MDSNLCYKELAVLKRGELEYNINLMMKGDNEARNKIINHYVKVIKNMIDRSLTIFILFIIYYFLNDTRPRYLIFFNLFITIFFNIFN